MENFAAAAFFVDFDALRPSMPIEICFNPFTGGINRKEKLFFFNVYVINKKGLLLGQSCKCNCVSSNVTVRNTLNHSIHTVRVELFHARTELNNENKVILLTNCDFIHYTFGWFSEGLLDKRQHFLFNSIQYPSFSSECHTQSPRDLLLSRTPKQGEGVFRKAWWDPTFKRYARSGQISRVKRDRV